MAWEAWPGLGASFARQILNSEHGSTESGAEEQHCTCLPAEHLGTEVEHVIVQACLWVAFAISLIILAYYMWCTWKGHCGWEEVYVVTIEMLKTIIEVFFETYAPATILQFNGVHISWLRYAEWLLTCPVILIHLSNLTGLGQYNKRTMRLLVSDIGTIVCGVTAALSKGPGKIVFFVFGLCYGASTFLTAASVYVSAYKEVPEGECKLLVKLCAWTFFGSWLLFPILFLMGPEGFGHLSPWGSIIAHTFADLLSKNLWGLLAHHLRNKVQEHMRENGGHLVAPEDHEERQQAEEQLMSNKLKRSSAPPTPRAAAITGHTVAEGDVIARITAGQSYTSSPTKALATLSRKSSGIWNPAAVEPVRVLLGLPAENADTVLEQFQEQFAALPVAAEALPATGVAALLAAAANASAFGGADAVLLHISYLRADTPGVTSGADLLDALQQIGIRVYVYGCDMGGIPDDMSELAASLDGFVEGPTWATPLNNRQIAALLLLLHATHTGSRPPSVQGHSRPVSPSSIPLRANSMGPILRTASGIGLAAPMTGMQGNRRSLDLAQAMSPMSPMRTATLPVPPPVAATGPPPPSATATTPAAGQRTFDDAEILQQLMAEIARLKKELSKEV